MKRNYDGWWYFFMLFIFSTAFLIAPLTTNLGFLETLNYADWFISDFTFGFLGSLLYIPVGIVTYLMPNDISYFLLAFFLLGFGTGPFLVYLFFATTYPPGTKYRKEEGRLIVSEE